MKNQKLTFLFVLALALTGCNLVSSTISSNASFNNDSSTKSSSSICEHDFVYDSDANDAPTIIQSQGAKYVCNKCGAEKYENASYDLNEYEFVDQSYLYDGNEHQLTIRGMIPYGCTVEYENNSLKEIGEKEATARVYDEKHQLVDLKKAKIHIIENTGMPNIRIDTNNKPVESKETYVPMTLSTDNCNDKYKLNDAPGEIRCRGNGTMTYDKKPYRIKFTSKTNMLGLNHGSKAKSWVLLAEYADQSMVRNATAFYLGNSLFNYSDNYCSDYMPVNVYLNGKYNGVYVLAEQQQANSNRIKINEAEKNDTSTDVGYLIELDSRASEEDYYFSVGKGTDWSMFPGGGWGGNAEQPDKLDGVSLYRKDYAVKTDVYSQDQVNYIKKYLTNVYYAFYKAVHGDGLFVLDDNNELVASPYTTQFETLNSIIDLESVFKMYLLHEYMKDVDVGFGSFYMFVDFSTTSKYKRLTFGAPWDFDWSSGNVNTSECYGSSGEYCSKSQGNFNPWFFMLSRTDFFKSMFKKYYSVFKNSQILEGAIAQANYFAAAFKNDYVKNYQKWDNLGKITPKYTPDIARTFKSHQDAVDYLTKWLTDRKKSLDQIFKQERELLSSLF